MLIANAVDKYSPVLEGIYVAVFFIWLVTLNETPIDFRVYASKLICDQDNLQVIYWLTKKNVQLQWDTINRLVYIEPVCTIYTNSGRVRFLASERYGCKEKAVLLKTIVKRGNLNFVEGNYTKMEYRRYEA